jgi:organic radical activating enzyme
MILILGKGRIEMNFITNLIEKVFPPAQPLPAGIYNYQPTVETDFPYRIHLRLEKGGTGILIINASTVFHLNQTAAEFAYHLVHQTHPEETAQSISKRYGVSKEQARQDYEDFLERIDILVNTPDLDPITYFDFDRTQPYADSGSAPYRLDCALTYRVLDDQPDKIAPVDRVKRELLTEEWQSILDKAWQAGIPHVVFTGGEPTIRPDLPELIQHAEKLGQVTGLLSNGLRLTDPDYRQELLLSGLDHLMIIFDPENEASWEVVRDIMPEDIFTTVHLTVTDDQLDEYIDTLEKLAALDVQSISLSTTKFELKETVTAVQNAAIDRDMTLVWDLPVPYSRFNPVALELENGEETAEGAGKAWLYVEPDGDVLAAQGLPAVLGNLMDDSWEQIWHKA